MFSINLPDSFLRTYWRMKELSRSSLSSSAFSSVLSSDMHITRE
ncbi:MAG: hypothetical protein P4M11_13285 [Candidatus Pacebacteria bacterium]|nr:hypothetical protein [Candidatus Paceibacterota bacterium]